LDSSLLRNISFHGSVQGHDVQVEGKGEQVGLVESLRAMGAMGGDWQVSVTDSLEASLTAKTNGSWSVESRIQIENLSFQNPQGTFMGDGLTTDITVGAQWKSARPTVSVKGTMTTSSGELLYDRFYGNLGKRPLTFSWEADYNFLDKSLDLSDLQLELKGAARIQAQGTLVQDPMDIRMNLQVPNTPLGALYRLFLLEPFQAEMPSLQQVDVGGTVGADIQVEWRGARWSAKGRLLWDEGVMSIRGGNADLQGVRLDLPFWLTSGTENSPEAFQRGNLFLTSMKFPYLVDQPLKLDLRGGPNTLEIQKPTRLQTLGGDVLLGPIAIRTPPNDPFSLKTSLTVDDLNLSPFLSKLWPQTVEGTLTGKLKPIHLTGNELTTTGLLRARVFGGEIILDQLGGAGMLTPAPVFKMRVELDGLRLGQLTKDTSFGRIQGVLSGHIRDLEIAYGQPQRFDMVLETVETKGVDQKISVKAVDNIAQIGGGRSPFMGMAGGFAALFKEFPYEKMGIHALLENDVFRINGTITENGTEYLVKRGGLSGVNVVNQNPENRISFKDMVKRMKRITSSGSGPVIQ
jgi:hypothetical protein